MYQLTMSVVCASAFVSLVKAGFPKDENIGYPTYTLRGYSNHGILKTTRVILNLYERKLENILPSIPIYPLYHNGRDSNLNEYFSRGKMIYRIVSTGTQQRTRRSCRIPIAHLLNKSGHRACNITINTIYRRVGCCECRMRTVFLEF
jgi:hypothetical protein